MTLNRSTVHLLISWRTAAPCECKRNIDTGPLPSTNPLCQYSASLHNADGFRVGLMVTSRWCQSVTLRWNDSDWLETPRLTTDRTDCPTDIAMYTVSQKRPTFVMAVLRSRCGCGHYIFVLFLLSFFSSPNLSGRRLDVCHTCTHDLALVRI